MKNASQKNTAIIYAIQSTKLVPIGTYSTKTAVRMLHDTDLIKKYGPLVAISCDDGTIVQSIVVDVQNPNTLAIINSECFYDIDAARHFSAIMNIQGYITNIH